MFYYILAFSSFVMAMIFGPPEELKDEAQIDTHVVVTTTNNINHRDDPSQSF